MLSHFGVQSNPVNANSLNTKFRLARNKCQPAMVAVSKWTGKGFFLIQSPDFFKFNPLGGGGVKEVSHIRQHGFASNGCRCLKFRREVSSYSIKRGNFPYFKIRILQGSKPVFRWFYKIFRNCDIFQRETNMLLQKKKPGKSSRRVCDQL